MSESGHIPVLLAETLAALSPREGEVYLDCTAGRGGHAAAIAPFLGPTGTVVLCDLDAVNLAFAAERVGAIPNPPRVLTLHASFAQAPRFLVEQGLRADCVLADLGFASTQVDDPARGLSFMRDGPLDMRLNPASGPTAADLVASMPEAELVRLIAEYGEERRARAVAAAIVAARRGGGGGAGGPIRTTTRLAEIVRSVVRREPGGIDPATRTFQALRIAVNDELGNLEALLEAVDRGARAAAAGADKPVRQGDGWLAPGARVAVITFHSLEDRPVKRAFAAAAQAGLARDACGVVKATPAEVAGNPRAGSAKLRAIVLAGAVRS